MCDPARTPHQQPPGTDPTTEQAPTKRRQTPVTGFWTPAIREYHHDERLAEEVCAATGCDDPAAGALLVEQAAMAHPEATPPTAGTTPSPPAEAANQARQLLAEIAPRGGIEALLAVELVALHNMTMHIARSVQETAGGDIAAHPGIRVLDRLSGRTVRIAEALGNLRRGGKQEVVIRREQTVTERDADGREVVDRRSVEARGGRRQGDPGGG